MDMDGWLSPSRAPARVTFSSSRSARSVRSRLRSMLPSGMALMLALTWENVTSWWQEGNPEGVPRMAGVSSIDFNLLIVLAALLEERNLTRAGEKVNISQPAMSG